jgi:hypothetical protein
VPKPGTKVNVYQGDVACGHGRSGAKLGSASASGQLEQDAMCDHAAEIAAKKPPVKENKA